MGNVARRVVAQWRRMEKYTWIDISFVQFACREVRRSEGGSDSKEVMQGCEAGHVLP